MRTINCISYFVSTVEKIIKEKLIPALFDGFPISEEFRKLLTLPCKLGEMGIIDPTENANDEYKNSRELTGQLTNSIKQKEHLQPKASNLQLRRNARTKTLIF